MSFVAEVHIQSYFSIETDLAAVFEGWEEFVSGKEYDVVLFSPATGERVEVNLTNELEDERPYVQIRSSSGGELFDRVFGRASYELAAHSDNLMVHRWNPKPE